MLEDEEITTWKVWISTGKTRTSTGEREDQPEEENIGRRAETSTGKRKHRPEIGNINRKMQNIGGWKGFSVIK
ncbi:hypothetical protein KK120_22145 [Virgibacillus dakarensis]|nr:hypothetical protein [Virgibacillus dakarensis]